VRVLLIDERDSGPVQMRQSAKISPAETLSRGDW
jgi:hypothetical protein